MNHYDWLIAKLDAFIRRYYANQLIRGILILLTALLIYVLSVSLGEYYLYLPVWARVSLVSAFLLLGTAALAAWVILPVFKMAKLGKIISHEQAALIIGEHFPEISDKLLNILQLRKQSDQHVSRELIEASIDQKASQISLVPIARAIDFSRNKKYLPYLLPLMLLGIVILIFSPGIFTEASERLLQPTKEFEKPAPFRFIVTNRNLRVIRNEDFTLSVKTIGNALPQTMFIEAEGERLQMLTKEKNIFEYTFKNVAEAVPFRLYAGGFYSEKYILSIVRKPVLKSFKMELDYPSYTGKKDEVRNSIGDISVPAGTVIRWSFITDFTDKASLFFRNNPSEITLPDRRNRFEFQAKMTKDTSYELRLRNKESELTEKFAYHVQVIPDQYPVLQLQEFRDTVTGKQILLNGTAGDDYAVSRVLFHYSVLSDKNQPVFTRVIPLNIRPGALTEFQHYFDIGVLDLKPGQKLNYFVEAWDNDGVQGSKATRSQVMSYFMLNENQLDSAINANARQINSGLSNSSRQNQRMRSEFSEMKSKMLQSDKMDWEQQQSLRELAEKQQQMAQQLENTKKLFEEQIQQSKQKQYSEEVREKQEALQKQMDHLLNEELKEQMKKLEELMAKLNKENAFQTMKQMEQENKLFNMDLERMKELMKNLEMQMRMEDMANKMDKLAEKQLELKKETDQGKKDNQSISKEQEALKKELDKAMSEDMKQMQELNKETGEKQDLSDIAKEGGEAGERMQQSQQQLNQNQKSKSSESQNKAAQNLQQMAASLRSAAGGMDMQQIEIDIRAVRQLLTNLMRLSFDQENLMDKVKITNPSSSAYLTNQKEQNRLHKNSLMVRDSLFVLSKRIFKLAPTINKETAELEKNMQYSKESLEARRIGEALTRQQYVMTRTNNLALMLNEMLSNLMQMQSQAMKSQQQGNCQKPGGKQPKPGAGQQLSDVITRQKQLGDAMQQMEHSRQQRQGQKPGQEGKEGSQGNNQGSPDRQNGEYGDAEQLARMAQQQAAIRRQIQELQSLLNSRGMGAAKELQELQEKMDKTETDLVNRRLTSELLMRQKEIMTRLLETEKAVREQEEDDKRSSKTPPDIARPVPPELQQFLRDRQSMMEIYKTVPPSLKPYYKNMVEQYYKLIGNSGGK